MEDLKNELIKFYTYLFGSLHAESEVNKYLSNNKNAFGKAIDDFREQFKDEILEMFKNK